MRVLVLLLLVVTSSCDAGNVTSKLQNPVKRKGPTNRENLESDMPVPVKKRKHNYEQVQIAEDNCPSDPACSAAKETTEPTTKLRRRKKVKYADDARYADVTSRKGHKKISLLEEFKSRQRRSKALHNKRKWGREGGVAASAPDRKAYIKLQREETAQKLIATLKAEEKEKRLAKLRFDSATRHKLRTPTKGALDSSFSVLYLYLTDSAYRCFQCTR